MAPASYQEALPDWVSQAPDSRTALVIVVWARDGQAPARAQTLVFRGAPPVPPCRRQQLREVSLPQLFRLREILRRPGYLTNGGLVGDTCVVQYMHRVAAIGIVLRHSGQSRVVTAAS